MKESTIIILALNLLAAIVTASTAFLTGAWGLLGFTGLNIICAALMIWVGLNELE